MHSELASERLRRKLSRLWSRALDDAGLAHEDIRLYPSEGQPESWAPWASFADPGDDIYELTGHQFYFTPEDALDARANRHLGQVAIWSDASQVELLAIMRHELQHAVQKRDDPGAALANGMLGEAIERVFGTPARRAIHHLLPAERDANRAALSLAIAEHDEPLAELTKGEHATLFHLPSDTPAPGELGPRTLALAALVPRMFGDVYPHEVPDDWTPERKALGLAGVILGPEGRDLWGNLAASVEMPERRIALASAVEAALAAPTRDWSLVRDLFSDAERFGLTRLQLGIAQDQSVDSRN